MKLHLVLILATFLVSCVNFEAITHSAKSGEASEKKVNSNGKVVEVYLSYTNSAESFLYKSQSNHGNFYLETAFASFLNDTFKFKTVNLKPTDYQKIAMADKFKNDLVLTVLVSEKSIDLESFGQAVLRGLSFGIVKQDVQKNIDYKIELKDLKSGKTVQTASKVEAIYQYQAPMLVIPFNLDSHPFVYSQQAAIHIENLKTLAQRIIQ